MHKPLSQPPPPHTHTVAMEQLCPPSPSDDAGHTGVPLTTGCWRFFITLSTIIANVSLQQCCYSHCCHPDWHDYSRVCTTDPHLRFRNCITDQHLRHRVVPSAIVSEDTFSSQSCELHTSWLSANLFCKCIVTRYSSPPHMHTPTQAATLNVNLV